MVALQAGNHRGGSMSFDSVLPPSYAKRVELNDEVHARPPEILTAPCRVSQLALLPNADEARDAPWAALCALAQRFSVPPPAPGANHYSADFGPFRLKWERHGEFSRFMVVVAGEEPEPFGAAAIHALPADWLKSLPGQVIAAAHVSLLASKEVPLAISEISRRYFRDHMLVGGPLAGGQAHAFTDFRIHGDGFSRFLIFDGGMSPYQAGRLTQRLLEMETYRIMALLALPVAQEVAPQIGTQERELAEISAALVEAQEADEPLLLQRLTRMAAEAESRESRHRFRFSAAAAYYELVRNRIQELRELRMEGMQTFGEFTERRLAPAMNTCKAVATRQEMLSQRVARATQLLSTRVDITRERQNQALLASMERRARQQLRLQQAVEGFSVAAITYYVVGLVAYLAKGLVASGFALRDELVTGMAIPIVALAVALGVRRFRRRMADHD
jgi:uncharacterized membrane-anchored protein